MGKFMDSPVQNLFRAFVVIQTLNSFAASAPVGIAPLSFVYTYEDSLEITLSHMTPYILADATCWSTCLGYYLRTPVWGTGDTPVSTVSFQLQYFFSIPVLGRLAVCSFVLVSCSN
jgi:hypothetical protein